jgi:hypothetical protein
MRKQREIKKNKFAVFFIGFIMVASAFGVVFFGFGGDTSTIKYKGYKFIDKGNYYTVNIEDNELEFAYTPYEVEQIPVDAGIIDRLKNANEIDATPAFNDSSPQEIALAQYQLSMAMYNRGTFVRNGFTSKNKDFSVITCQNATNFVPVIYFRSSNTTDIRMENNCIIAEGANGFDILRLKDRLVYGVFGII